MKRKILSLLLALLLLPVTMTGSALGESSQAAVSVTDMMGRQVSLNAPVTRIVALTASDCEILYAIGAGNMLVGRGEYCNYPAEVSEVPSVQSGSETNIEQIIALSPQVVLMNTMAQAKDQVEALEAAGIQVVVSDAKTIDEVYESITLIGDVTGKIQEAASLVSGMKNTFADIASKATGDGTKTIYFEVSPLQWGLWTAGSGTFMDELASLLGLTNAFSDVKGWGEISQEQVIERNPDYIVTITMYYGDGPKPVEEIMNREGWQDLKAIQNRAVFNADSDEMSRPGPRLTDAINSLYQFVYEPETFVPAA